MTLDSLRELLDATKATYRLDRQGDGPVYEIRIDGWHWGFVRINDDEHFEVIPAKEEKQNPDQEVSPS